uniref:Uncharacterized protein n=1 Tax=Lotharella globosa TaxID=91324 RepID=A0A7S3ZA24_9EUKA
MLASLLLVASAVDAGLLRGSGILSRRFGGEKQSVDFVLGGLEGRWEGSPAANSTTHFYQDALLDHFANELGDAQHWSQRFYVDDSHWGGEGYPVFLYIGGEGPQGPVSPRLFMYELATEHRALILALEHRYYGESRPVPDMSTANLKYLTSHQALGDLARFVQYIKSFHPGGPPDTASTPPLSLQASPKRSSFVVFGGSYPGNLAAWLKLKYPSLIEGSVSSSAPVFAEYNFEQYASVVGFALGYPLIGGTQECYDIVAKGTEQLRSLVESTSPMGTSEAIPDALKPCTTINDELDLSTYEATVFGAFQGVVQYNLEGRPPYVSDVCAEITNASHATALDALASAVSLVLFDGEPKCLPSSFAQDAISGLANESFSAAGCDLDCASMRQWIYQSCNEFGYFQTTTGNVSNPFSSLKSVNLANAGQAVCQRAYGITDYASPAKNDLGLAANTAYGARELSSSNITVVNGNSDPWHSLGIVNSTDPFFNSGDAGSSFPQAVTPSESIVEIDGTAHCRDMYASGVFGEDPDPISWAHAVIRQNVARYVSA